MIQAEFSRCPFFRPRREISSHDSYIPTYSDTQINRSKLLQFIDSSMDVMRVPGSSVRPFWVLGSTDALSLSVYFLQS
jgi:hypothetical protein